MWRPLTLESLNASPKRNSGWKHPAILRAAAFLLLFGLWLVLSGQFYLEFLVLGAVSSALVVFLIAPIAFSRRAHGLEPLPPDFSWLGLAAVRLFLYIPWLLYEILIANLQVAYLILHPRMPISPRLIRFRTGLSTELSQVLLAQSITLTPGTITVDVSQDTFVVHTLAEAQRQGIVEGEMLERVARIFGGPQRRSVVIDTITDISELR